MSIAYRENDVQAVAIEATPYTAQGFNDLLNERNEFKRLYDEEYARRCEAEERIETLEEENHRYLIRINDNEYERQRRKELLHVPNSELSAIEKLVLLEYRERTLAIRVDHHTPTVHCMEHVAAAVGGSPDTVKRANKAMHRKGVINYAPGKTERKDNGSFYTPVTIGLTELVDSPESIHNDASVKHGGAREKRCPKCGSDDVDNYTVMYCRNCRKNHWYGQAGLRKDADVREAMKAQKQDAFGVSSQLLGGDAWIDTLTNDTPPTIVTQELPTAPAIETIPPAQKQDAFDEIEHNHSGEIIPTPQKQDAFRTIPVDLANSSEQETSLQDQETPILPDKENEVPMGGKLQVCKRCGEVPTFILTPLGNKVCSCSQLSRDELKARKAVRQIELL